MDLHLRALPLALALMLPMPGVSQTAPTVTAPPPSPTAALLPSTTSVATPATAPSVPAAVPSSPASGPVAPGTMNTEQVGRVLAVFLALALVFESALTPIFNWRVFLARFEGKGLKTPITIGLAFVVFWGYGLDIIRDLLVALGYSANVTKPGQLLTAMLIAGGSDGVLRIFSKLGIRSPEERQQKAVQAQAELAKERADAARREPLGGGAPSSPPVGVPPHPAVPPNAS